MIYAKPGDSFTALVEGVPTGLTGTLGVRIENANGTNQTARTTAGIAELEAGSGTYAKANLVAPTTRGTYVVLWDTGGGSPTFKAETLSVVYTLPVASFGPVTLGELEQQVNVPSGHNAELLQRVLDAAIAFAKKRTGRQLEALDGESLTVVGAGNLIRVPDIRDLTELSIDGSAVDSSSWRLVGGTPAPYLELFGLPVLSESVVELTGDFGFDPLPADLHQAILEEAANRYYDRETGNSDSAASDEYGPASYSRPPGWARAVFDSYRIKPPGFVSIPITPAL